MKIIKYDKKYKQSFIDFNTDWIVENFGFLEENDINSFNSIEENISKGGMIFFALEDENCLACCMAVPLEDEAWEICKLGSNKNLPHKGAGSAVFKACMDYATENGAKKLCIISNSKLKAALHIYEKYGFKEMKLNDYHYERGNIAFEYNVPEKIAR